MIAGSNWDGTGRTVVSLGGIHGPGTVGLGLRRSSSSSWERPGEFTHTHMPTSRIPPPLASCQTVADFGAIFVSLMWPPTQHLLPSGSPDILELA